MEKSLVSGALVGAIIGLLIFGILAMLKYKKAKIRKEFMCAIDHDLVINCRKSITKGVTVSATYPRSKIISVDQDGLIFFNEGKFKFQDCTIVHKKTIGESNGKTKY